MRNFFIYSLIFRIIFIFIVISMQDEQIMCLALLKVTALNMIVPADLSDLRRLFNLSEKDSFAEGILELKKTISFIILIERTNIQEYLMLPKFRSISSHLNHILTSYFTQLWQLFQIEKMAINKQTFKSYQQTQTPMEKISKSIADLKMSDQRENFSHPPFDRFSNFFPPFAATHKDNKLGYSNQDLPPYLFSYQSYMGADLFNSFSNLNGGAGIYNNIVLPNRTSSEPFPVSIGQNVGKSSQDNPIDPVIYKKQQISERQMNSQMQIEQPRGCFCGDGPDQTLINCTRCERKFHLRCWQSQHTVDAICPFCRVVKMHAYTKVVGVPIFERCSLTDQQFFRSKIIRLKEDELKVLTQAIRRVEYDDKVWVELRVLKVSKDYQQQKKGFKSCFSISISQLRKMQERKQLELKFKNIVQGDCIIFVLVCITPKNQGQFLAEYQLQVSNRNENIAFVKDWLISKGLSSFKVNTLHPVTNARVLKPVRGIRCVHLECEELAFVYEQGIKKDGKILCSYCRKEYSMYEPFQVDRCLQHLIQKNNQTEIEINLTDLEFEGHMAIQQESQR